MSVNPKRIHERKYVTTSLISNVSTFIMLTQVKENMMRTVSVMRTHSE